jgi:hypothetical protein
MTTWDQLATPELRKLAEDAGVEEIKQYFGIVAPEYLAQRVYLAMRFYLVEMAEATSGN